jgi:ComF family protein
MVCRSALLDVLAPPLCAACERSITGRSVLCSRCAKALDQARPQHLNIPGVEQAVAACLYAGTARRIVAALKFSHRLSLAEPMARAIARALSVPPGVSVVPVPPAPSRLRRRGFDSAGELAAQLADTAERPLSRCLRRADGPRQVGRQRELRLADPPRVRLAGSPPSAVLLVDDVVTTGATLAACAQALSNGGVRMIAAVAFAHSRLS